MNDDTVKQMRERLEEERASIERQLEEHGANAVNDDIHISSDEGFADSGQVTAERSEELGLIEQLRSMYAEVDRAMARIDEGSYGKCVRCGKEIPTERLQAIPTAELCVSCKQLVGSR